jgi:hypothetical protein
LNENTQYDLAPLRRHLNLEATFAKLPDPM